MRKTVSALLAQADATLEDNTTGAITAADVRALIKDVIDTLAPGFGAVGSPSVTLTALSATPVAVPYSELLAVTADYVATLAAGTVKRVSGGMPTVNNRILFFASVDTSSGAGVTFTLLRDGVVIPGGVTVVGRGAGIPVSASFSNINATASPGDPVFEVRAAKTTGGPVDVILTNVRFILEVVPTLGF